MENKIICFISPKFLDYVGGMETHALEFVNFFLNKEGYKINKIITRRVADDGISIPTRKTDKLIDKIIIPELTGNFEKDAELILYHSNPDKDIFYLNSPAWLPSLAIIKEKFPKARIFVRSGGNDIMAGWIGSEIDSKKSLENSRNHLVSLINLYAEKLIVNSAFSTNRMVSIGINPNKLVKITGGVDCNKFKPKQGKTFATNKIQIVNCSRLVKFKGVEYSLKAIKEIIKRTDKNIIYTIIGEGSEKQNLKKITKNLGIEKNVNFIGAFAFEEIPKLLSDKDIFLHLPIALERKERGSSYIHTETMGRSLCEAAASSLPSVSSNVGGVSEIVEDGKTGFLVKEKDYLGAADKILRLINNPEILSELGRNARIRALERFDFNKIFDVYDKLFRGELW